MRAVKNHVKLRKVLAEDGTVYIVKPLKMENSVES